MRMMRPARTAAALNNVMAAFSGNGDTIITYAWSIW